MRAQFTNEAFSPIDLFIRLKGKRVKHFPNTGNAGDGFISFSTAALLRQFGIEWDDCNADETVEGEIVLFGGGGNLVEGRYDTMADVIRRNVAQNRCFLLPHTIDGFEDIILEAQNGLTIFCREPASYDKAMALANGGANIHLAHDMAFYLGLTSFFQEHQRRPGKGKLACFREDGEALPGAVPPKNRDLSMSWNGDYWSNQDLCRLSTESLIAVLNRYEIIGTDRLHLAILCAFLNKRVLFGANAYFKNEQVYHHSIKHRFQNVSFYPRKEDLYDDFLRAKLSEPTE
jgi:exopolysaccharide biosynthesis predicted pyruvyltransferase EpsI